MVTDQPTFIQAFHQRQIIKSVGLYCLFLGLIAISISVQAQEIKCATGSPTMDQMSKLNEATHSHSQNRTLGAVKHIAIKPLVVRHTNGSGGATLEDLNQTLAGLNKTFKDLNVEFYFCNTGIKYIDNSNFYDFDSREEDALTEGNDVNHSINIYFINSLKINGFEGSGGYAYFPGSESYTNRIFIINEATKGGHMLAHELGHYFGLVHTFERIGGMEMVSRGDNGNCADAGDHICDTDADPYGMDGATWEGCEYTGTVTDMNGDLYSPPADNIMSYYNHCANRFTPGQFERMELGTSIRVSQTSYSLMSGTPAKVTPPANLTYANTNADITLKWTDLSDNETGFIIERSTSLDGGFVAIAGLGPNRSTFVDNSVLPGVAYYYRVKPSNTTNGYSNVVLHCPVISEIANIEGETETCSEEYNYSVPFLEGLSYNWSISSGGILTFEDNNATIKWTEPGLHSISVTPSNACVSGITKSIYVQVNDGDFEKASAIQGSDEVCLGESVYTAEAIEGADYFWELSSGGEISGEGNSVAVKWDTPGNHTISLSLSNSCGKGEAISLKVKVLENPDTEDIDAIQTRNTTVCIGTHQYSVKHFNDVQYNWSIPEGSGTLKSDGSNVEIDWEMPGTFPLTLEIISKCGDVLNKTLQIKVTELPEKPSISIVNGRLTSDLQGEHQWFIDGEPISGAIGPVCPVTLIGDYTVQQIGACGRGPISEVFTLDKPLENKEKDQLIFIFPNPATVNVSVELPSELVWESISMVTSMGESLIILNEKDIIDSSIRGNQYKRLINFDVEHLTPGIYLIKVQLADGMISKRLLVK